MPNLKKDAKTEEKLPEKELFSIRSLSFNLFLICVVLFILNLSVQAYGALFIASIVGMILFGLTWWFTREK